MSRVSKCKDSVRANSCFNVLCLIAASIIVGCKWGGTYGWLCLLIVGCLMPYAHCRHGCDVESGY